MSNKQLPYHYHTFHALPVSAITTFYDPRIVCTGNMNFMLTLLGTFSDVKIVPLASLCNWLLDCINKCSCNSC